MTKYDADIIYKFADRLYRQANFIIAAHTILGLLVGGIGGYYLGITLNIEALPIVGAVLAGLIGLAMGNGRAFMLKLQAQTALCQVKIEENTRKGTLAR